MCSPTSSSGSTDLEGNYTGEVKVVYGSPVTIYLALYPSTGEVTERIFGKDSSYDMVAISNDVILTENTLLFLTSPTANYDATYDYCVSQILKSINTYRYGLKRRT